MGTSRFDGFDHRRHADSVVRLLVDLRDSQRAARTDNIFIRAMIFQTAAAWEAAFAPYDETTYQAVLDALRPDDIVLDIGAGDLRFAKRAALRVTQVIAIEQRAELLPTPLLPKLFPQNLRAICGDARKLAFPKNITTAVLLMRHCLHFALYREKLEDVGCERLITNARWGMHVEVMGLNAPRQNFLTAPCGWYACKCGAVGFKEGVAVKLDAVMEMEFCPRCVRA